MAGTTPEHDTTATFRCGWKVLLVDGSIQRCTHIAEKQKGNLRDHEEAAHLGWRYRCNYCFKLYHRYSKLGRHIEKCAKKNQPFDDSRPSIEYFTEEIEEYLQPAQPPDNWVLLPPHSKSIERKAIGRASAALTLRAKSTAGATQPVARPSRRHRSSNPDVVIGTSVPSTAYFNFNEVNKSTAQSLQTPGASSSSTNHSSNYTDTGSSYTQGTLTPRNVAIAPLPELPSINQYSHEQSFSSVHRRPSARPRFQPYPSRHSTQSQAPITLPQAISDSESGPCLFLLESRDSTSAPASHEQSPSLSSMTGVNQQQLLPMYPVGVDGNSAYEFAYSPFGAGTDGAHQQQPYDAPAGRDDLALHLDPAPWQYTGDAFPSTAVQDDMDQRIEWFREDKDWSSAFPTSSAHEGYTKPESATPCSSSTSQQEPTGYASIGQNFDWDDDILRQIDAGQFDEGALEAYLFALLSNDQKL